MIKNVYYDYQIYIDKVIKVIILTRFILTRYINKSIQSKFFTDFD